MKLRVHPDQRTTPATPAEQFLTTLQEMRRGSSQHIQPIFENLERDFITLCDGLEPISRGDKSILMRALRMYMHNYQEMMGKEKAPAHKQDLKNYIDAAGALFQKLFNISPKETQHVRKV